MREKVQEAIELDIVEKFAEDVSLEMDEQIIADLHLEDDAKDALPHKVSRTLQSILDDTEYCTVVEKKAGHLYKKLDNSYDEKELNSDLITRIRYLLRTNKEDFLFKTKDQVISKIDFLVTCAYLDVYPSITTKELRESYRVEENHNKYDSHFFSIQIHAKCLERPMSFIRFDIDLA